MEFVREVDLPIEMFKEALGLNIGSANWYKEMCPSLPDEWCELFELHNEGTSKETLNIVTEELKKIDEIKYNKVVKYFDGEIPEILDNIDVELFSTDNIDELSTFGECTDISKFKECECILEWNAKE